MKTVAYNSPFVPPEWIAAHGMQPDWMRLRAAGDRSPTGMGRGVCPFAGETILAVVSGLQATAVVVTTVCDQMRRAAELIERDGQLPVFLMNVPSTWQTTAADELYVAELERLGRFFVQLGGEAPSNDKLARVMLGYDRARGALRAARAGLSARRFAEAVAGLRGGGTPASETAVGPPPAAGVPLALIGGPLPERHRGLLDLVERSGGRVVLDGTEGGERTMPLPFDREAAADDPLGELARAYFAGIPDVSRRPNDAFYQWLADQLEARQVRGILLRRYVWCDLWHAELHRLRQVSPVPVLDLDVDHEDNGSLARTAGRLEAFLEMLR